MEWTETMQIRCPFLQTHPRTLSAQNGISTTHLLDTGQTPYLCQTTVSCVPPALSYLSQIRIIHSSCQYFFRGRRDLFLKNTYNLLEAPVDINSVYNRKIHNLFSFFFGRNRKYSPEMQKSTRSIKEEDVGCFDVRGQEEGRVQPRGLGSHQRQNQDLSRGTGSSGIIPQYPLI